MRDVQQPSMDGKYVAFGAVIEGLAVLRRVEGCSVEGVPAKDVRVSGCGVVAPQPDPAAAVPQG